MVINTPVDASRIEEHGSRLYDVNGARLRINYYIEQTKDQQFIKDWKAKVGEAEADGIENLSSNLGGQLANSLGHYITGVGYDDLTTIGQEAKPMAEKIIEVGLTPVEEVYGSKLRYIILAFMLGLLI